MRARANLAELPPYLMNRLVGRLNRDLAVALRALGLSFAAWRVLAVLAADDGRSIVELSEFTIVPHATLSRLVARMTRAGLIARVRARDDGRVVRLRLRPRGRAVYARAFALAMAASNRAMAGFSARERAALDGLLRRMFANLGLNAPGGRAPAGSSPPPG